MFARKIGFLIFCSFLLFGCQDQNEEAEKLGVENTNSENHLDQRFLNVDQSSPNEKKELRSNRDIANHLANVAASVPNVNDASALVAGPYTVVAIDLDEDMEKDRVGTVKFSVSEALYHDPYGKTAVVIADGDITQRLQNMGEKISEGYPLHGIIDELSAIVGRYMPEFPVNDYEPIEPDNNKQMMPEDEKEQLDEIQKEQSKNIKQ